MTSPADEQRYSPLWELVMSRVRAFHREPEALFWVYGFPLIMKTVLGLAFQSRPIEKIRVDVAEPVPPALRAALAAHPKLEVTGVPAAEGRRRLARARTDLLIVPGEPPEFVYDASRAESALARAAAENALLRAAAPSAQPARAGR
jgi:hypothetical protein